MSHIEGILLAAGESRRMGYPKPLLQIGNETFIEHLTRAMLAVVPHLTIVIGAHADRVRPAIPIDARISIVENRDYLQGQLSSIKAGLRAIISNLPDAAAALIHLTDHPTVKPQTFAAVAERYRQSGQPIVIARYEGHRGHPVLFDRAMFAELLSAPEDQGARVVVNNNASRVVYAEVDDAGILLDLDTPEELHRAGLSLPAKI